MRLEIPIIPMDSASAEQARCYEVQRYRALQSKPLPSDRPQVIGQIANMAAFTASVDYREYHGRSSFKEEHDAQSHDYLTPHVLPGYAMYELPDALGQFSDVLQQIAAHEHANYPFACYDVVSLSTDQRPIAPGSAQRSGNQAWDRVHRDGEPGQWRHLYMVSSNRPTEFYEGTSKGWTNCNIVGNRRLTRVGFAAGEIIMANISALHRSPVFEEAAERTFLRITYEYDVDALLAGAAA